MKRIGDKMGRKEDKVKDSYRIKIVLGKKLHTSSEKNYTLPLCEWESHTDIIKV